MIKSTMDVRTGVRKRAMKNHPTPDLFQLDAQTPIKMGRTKCVPGSICSRKREWRLRSCSGWDRTISLPVQSRTLYRLSYWALCSTAYVSPSRVMVWDFPVLTARRDLWKSSEGFFRMNSFAIGLNLLFVPSRSASGVPKIKSRKLIIIGTASLNQRFSWPLS